MADSPAPQLVSAELAGHLAEAQAEREELRAELQKALTELSRHKEGWASINARLTDVKQSLADESRKRQLLERWQADPMRSGCISASCA